MGRILRKKAAPKIKKKKKSDVEGLSPANGETAPEEQAAVAAERDQPRKPVPTQRKPLPVAKPVQSGAVRNFLERAVQFLREVKVELKKVTWPSRKQTMGSTLVVIILVMIISLFLGVVDISLSSLIRLVF